MAASLVLLNGRLWSPDGVRAGCDAIVVGHGRIAAVTSSAAGPRGGRGGHARHRPEGAAGHPGVRRRARPSGGRWPREPALQPHRDAQPRRVPRHHRRLRARSRSRRVGPWRRLVHGGISRWCSGRGGPGGRRRGRPVFRPNRDHHSAWLSPAALARAGITRDTADPADGRIERDERGEPTGALHDGAMRLAAGLSRLRRPPISPACARGCVICTRWASRTGRTPSSARHRTSASRTPTPPTARRRPKAG